MQEFQGIPKKFKWNLKDSEGILRRVLKGFLMNGLEKTLAIVERPPPQRIRLSFLFFLVILLDIILFRNEMYQKGIYAQQFYSHVRPLQSVDRLFNLSVEERL